MVSWFDHGVYFVPLDNVSSAEGFAMMMACLPHVTMVGQPTREHHPELKPGRLMPYRYVVARRS